jgi:hypothetical protein
MSKSAIFTSPFSLTKMLPKSAVRRRLFVEVGQDLFQNFAENCGDNRFVFNAFTKSGSQNFKAGAASNVLRENVTEKGPSMKEPKYFTTLGRSHADQMATSARFRSGYAQESVTLIATSLSFVRQRAAKTSEVAPLPINLRNWSPRRRRGKAVDIGGAVRF